MTANFKPGGLAMVECSDGKERVALVGRRGGEVAFIFGDGMLRYAEDSNARPLVAIDPEDAEQVRQLTDAFYRVRGLGEPQLASSRILNMRSALRSLITPPKPEEPTGLGAVVEDAAGVRYVRVGPSLADMHWRSADPSDQMVRKWKAVDAVRILSEGVTP